MKTFYNFNVKMSSQVVTMTIVRYPSFIDEVL